MSFWQIPLSMLGGAAVGGLFGGGGDSDRYEEERRRLLGIQGDMADLSLQTMKDRMRVQQDMMGPALQASMGEMNRALGTERPMMWGRGIFEPRFAEQPEYTPPPIDFGGGGTTETPTELGPAGADIPYPPYTRPQSGTVPGRGMEIWEGMTSRGKGGGSVGQETVTKGALDLEAVMNEAVSMGAETVQDVWDFMRQRLALGEGGESDAVDEALMGEDRQNAWEALQGYLNTPAWQKLDRVGGSMQDYLEASGMDFDQQGPRFTHRPEEEGVSSTSYTAADDPMRWYGSRPGIPNELEGVPGTEIDMTPQVLNWIDQNNTRSGFDLWGSGMDYVTDLLGIEGPPIPAGAAIPRTEPDVIPRPVDMTSEEWDWITSKFDDDQLTDPKGRVHPEVIKGDIPPWMDRFLEVYRTEGEEAADEVVQEAYEGAWDARNRGPLNRKKPTPTPRGVPSMTQDEVLAMVNYVPPAFDDKPSGKEKAKSRSRTRR
jgi:hypothetical protein